MSRCRNLLLISRSHSLAGLRQQGPARFAAVYMGYAAALAPAPLEGEHPPAYDHRVSGTLACLASEDPGDPSPLGDPHARDFAARDYRAHLKTARKRSASTVNAHLTALDHFYVHLGLGRVQVRRDRLPKRAPRALDTREQKRYLRATERRPLARDRAIGRLLFYTGLRVSELTALDVDDVPLSARKGKVIVRSGKGGSSREIPLVDPSARAAQAEWNTERAAWPGAGGPALFLNRRGGRLSSRSVDQLLDE